MHVCVYMFKYIYAWSVYDTHICLYVWCICNTHLCIYALECMHVWRMKSWEKGSMYAYAHILTPGFVCVNLYMHVYIGMSMFMYGYMYLYAWILCMCICAGTYMYYNIHEYVYVCTGIYEQVHTCTFKCASVNLCVHGWCYLGGYNSSGCWCYYKQSFSPGRQRLWSTLHVSLCSGNYLAE